jgi:hypothetical protein
LAFTVDIRTPEGSVLQREYEHSFELANAMPEFDAMDYPVLRLVDPYGDTYFSGYQMQAVIPELERLAVVHPGPAVGRVLEMARRVQNEQQTFLVFVGD